MVSGKLISGSENGEMRIWDLSTRCSTKVLNPFASESSSENSTSCTISGILVKQENKNSEQKLLLSKKKASMAQKYLSYQPLQRFQKNVQHNDSQSCTLLLSPTPFYDKKEQFSTQNYNLSYDRIAKRQKLVRTTQSDESSSKLEDEVKRLKKELSDAESKIARWEKVNNKLASKLKKEQARAK